MSVPAESEVVAVNNRKADHKRDRKRKRGTTEKEPRDHKKKQKHDQDVQDVGNTNPERKTKRIKVHKQEDAPPDLILSTEVDHEDSGKKGKEKSRSKSGKKGKRNKDKKKAVPASSQSAIIEPEVSLTENVEEVDSTVLKHGENHGTINSDATPRKHKKKQQVTDDYTERDPEATKTSKRKKKVVAIDSDAAGTEVTPVTVKAHEDKPHKKKKRKHEFSISDGHMDTESSASHKKKRAHKDSEFPDPSEDTTLSDSARNALSYVHARVSSQPDWKFNKARQNWVLRNLWDDNAIPDKYFPSCMKYLVGVQGNTRKLLVQAGAKFIESSSDTKGQADPGEASVQDTDANLAEKDSPEEKERKRMLKKVRAQTLLAALQAREESAS